MSIDDSVHRILLAMQNAEERICLKANSRITYLDSADTVYFYGSSQLFNNTNLVALIRGLEIYPAKIDASHSNGNGNGNGNCTGISIKKPDLNEVAGEIEKL